MYRVFGMVDSLEQPTLITPWSFMHFLSGVVAYSVYRNFLPGFTYWEAFWNWFLLSVAYEVLDFDRTYLLKSGGDENTWPNTYVDIVFNVWGFVFAHLLNFDQWWWLPLGLAIWLIFKRWEFD